MQLPDFHKLRITQTSQTATQRTLENVDHLLVVVPRKPGPEVFRRLPLGRQLQRLFERNGSEPDSRVTARLANRRATGVTLSAAETQSAFKSLTWARKVLADCLREKPRTLGVLVAGLDDDARATILERIASAAAAAAFELPSFKNDGNAKAPSLESVRFFDCTPRMDLSQVHAEALGNNIARWLTAMPPNRLTAKTYRQVAQALAKRHGLRTRFLDERELAELGAGAFLAVSQGNAGRDAGLLRLSYTPSKSSGANGAALCLVGKGVLFDTGGTNLKPFKGMLDMHTDMQGSAVALGVLVALAELRVPYPVDAWLALTENRLSASAYKPQDVVRAANGTTIQVIHTDAEGRMVLADALALAARESPAVMIDYATLTGACVAALTERYSGVFSNRQHANQLMLEAGAACGERVWPFPMDEDFDDALQSDVADIKQCAVDGHGDHILAARFLSKFVPSSIPWIHIDLAAGAHKGGLAHVPSEITGFGVRLTLELLRRHRGSPPHLAGRLSA